MRTVAAKKAKKGWSGGQRALLTEQFFKEIRIQAIILKYPW
jgi:hypothetical protein